MLIKLRSLIPGKWQDRTSAGSWAVKQIATHLLYGNLRAASLQRDGYCGESPGQIKSYWYLEGFLNRFGTTLS